MKSQNRNWTKFWLHFAFGVVLGAFVGIGIYSQMGYALSPSDSNIPLIAIVSSSSLAVGILGGIYGDDLWMQIHKWI